MAPHRHDDDRTHGPESTGSFVRRLLRRFKGEAPPNPQRSGQENLAPAGQRSGTGAASAEKYLQEERNSRPTPLE